MKKKYLYLLLIIILPLFVYFIGRSFSITYTEEIRSVEIQSSDYNQPGSWHIDKSAEWTGFGKARVTFDLNSVIKIPDNHYRDIIFVIDISGSMDGDKLDRAKQDAIELINFLLLDSNNRVALITFDTDSEVVSGFTNNINDMLGYLNNLTTRGCTNYNAGLLNVNSVMNGYERQSNRDLVMLFLTDGYPNEDTPNQVSTYKVLKDKYPYMTINGIQYEMGQDIIQEIIDISDNQFIADMDSLNSVLFEAAVAPAIYDNFVVTDYINDDFFYVNSLDDIKTTLGEVSLETENGVQKIIWNFGNTYISGRNAKLYINLSLKEEYRNTSGFYPTNKSEKILSKLPEENERTINSELTPVLKNAYNVIYDVNTPSGCVLPSIPTEEHFVYQNVTIRSDNLSCNGYLFKGWKIDSEDNNDIKKVNSETFIMPKHNVTIRATWTKQDLEKDMVGMVHPHITLYKVLEQEAQNGTLAKEYIGEHKDSFIREGTEKIYHWYATNSTQGTQITNKNNVIFAGMCWQMIRTTDTGGVKLQYNGEVDNNQCLDTRSNHPGYNDTINVSLNDNYWYGTSYEYDTSTNLFRLSGDMEQAIWSSSTSNQLIGKYTCRSTDEYGTCSTLYLAMSGANPSTVKALKIVNSINFSMIGKVGYNSNDRTLAYVGYMYNKSYSISEFSGKTYYVVSSNGWTINSDYYYSDTIDYGNVNANKYTLINPELISSLDNNNDLVGKYILDNSSTNSTKARYVVAISDNKVFYHELTNGNLTTSLSFGDSYTEENGVYTLNDPVTSTFIEWYQGAYVNYKGKYVCEGSSGSCTVLMHIFPDSYTSPSNKSFSYMDTTRYYPFANSFTYSNNTYTLSGDVQTVWDLYDHDVQNFLSTHHYTCLGGISCTTIKYFNIFFRNYYRYNNLTGGASIEDVIQETLYAEDVNKYDSNAKYGVEAWFRLKLIDYIDFLEETIFCNNREISSLGGWDPNGGVVQPGDLFFTNDGLLCTNITDQFSTSNPSAKLNYDVGLVTRNEMQLFNVNSARYNYEAYTTMSPHSVNDIAHMHRVYTAGNMTEYGSCYNCGIRPTISLKKGMEYSGGDGSKENPYIVDTST